MIAAKIREQCAIRKSGPQFVCPVQGERGFADAAKTFDHHDQHATRCAAGEHRIQLADFVIPAGKIRHRGRQLSGSLEGVTARGCLGGSGNTSSRTGTGSCDEHAQQAAVGAQRLITAARQLDGGWLVAVLDLAQVSLAVMHTGGKVGERKTVLGAEGTQTFPECSGRNAGFAGGPRLFHPDAASF
ncbi:MAG TPA: hypothetical protein VFX16_05335 [Pseudonocardiaceae bacterium]|nr:hypothetical protein [Pseudonocardiaceae bacterium]